MFLISRQKGAANPEGVPFSFCKVLGDDHYVRDDAYFIPFWLKTPPQNESQQEEMFKRPPPPQTAKANVSELTRQYLISLGFDDPDGLPDVACLPWLHALAVGFAPQYVVPHRENGRTQVQNLPQAHVTTEDKRHLATRPDRRIQARLGTAWSIQRHSPWPFGVGAAV